MKKFFAILLIAVTFTACNGGKNDAPVSKSLVGTVWEGSWYDDDVAGMKIQNSATLDFQTERKLQVILKVSSSIEVKLYSEYVYNSDTQTGQFKIQDEIMNFEIKGKELIACEVGDDSPVVFKRLK